MILQGQLLTCAGLQLLRAKFRTPAGYGAYQGMQPEGDGIDTQPQQDRQVKVFVIKAPGGNAGVVFVDAAGFEYDRMPVVADG